MIKSFILKPLISIILAAADAIYSYTIYPILFFAYKLAKPYPELVKLIDLWLERMSEDWPPEKTT